jgi:hypothetical protein
MYIQNEILSAIKEQGLIVKLFDKITTREF